MNTKDMKSLEFELNNLYQKVRIYSQKNDYIYTRFMGSGLKNIISCWINIIPSLNFTSVISLTHPMTYPLRKKQ